MATKTSITKTTKAAKPTQPYESVHGGIVDLLQSARVAAARSVNALMTASYWEIGRRIVEAEQGGSARAGYGQQLIRQLSIDLGNQFGRGFSADNLERMRVFYQAYSPESISATLSRKFGMAGAANIPSTLSREFKPLLTLADIAKVFVLPWSAYTSLLRASKVTTLGGASVKEQRFQKMV